MASEVPSTSSSAGPAMTCGWCNADRSPRSVSLPEGTWTYDPSHYPEPMTPLSADVWFWAMGLGIRAAARDLRAPFGGFDTMTVEGGWAYERELDSDWEPDIDVLEAAALSIAERWDGEYRARSHAITDELHSLRP